ncbi:SDR family oxidoreductase [Candidatus Albibeggiatoa sp. nov. NOAA]|uniref:SDR family NAD(P)-dependent oxidoreductase n=1 Tax=Candidatus Albibeggiatoa sp. nov. NOAA TaxID=3162724 RepID=UPI0032FFAC3E|nr:SDR family oxidoreductase [Thiotrichaceae bacterium]
MPQNKTTEQKKPFVLITGASGGIGQALVEVFTQANYRVIAIDINKAPNNLQCHYFIQADLQRIAKDDLYAQQILSKITAYLGDKGLKGLINNAAIQILGEFDTLSRKNWYETLETNLLAPVFLTQALLKHLEIAQGCVLNISSIHANLTKPHFTAYATSKAALSGLTRAMAVELGNKIRINALEPAAIDTPMLRAGFEHNTEGFEQLKHFHPSKSIGTPKELGKLARLIIEYESLFLNGAIIPFDGGIGTCLYDPN